MRHFSRGSSMLLVTGVSGGLGQLVAERLADRDDVVLGTRAPLPGARRVDFDDPESLPQAFAGVDTLLLISAGDGEDDSVIARHDGAISAAEQAGVRHVVYTSLTGAGDHLPYALAHRWTERRLSASTSLKWTVLRNGLYSELLAFLAAPGADGRLTAPLADGRLAAVARADLAEIAARVALDPTPHAGRVYELVGPRALGGAELAAVTGTAFEPETLAAARQRISASGALDFQVPMLVGTYSAIAGGFLATTDMGELRDLLGRAPLDPLDVYAEAVTAVVGAAADR
ncbi:NAD(P)H-binding protein [Streptomyces sp. NPDC059991]|uniref:NAD(P)H-binding protein n=1 Tax=unclassified Streptomyces TaxID=2593676 RepID=UPI0036ACC9B7